MRLILLGLALAMQAIEDPGPVLEAHVRALGGEEALRGIQTRVIEGRLFDSRGTKNVFRLLSKAPNQMALIIGHEPIDAPAGSGRGFDGSTGWAKNYEGLGVHAYDGPALADIAREADMLRPLRFRDGCSQLTVERRPGLDAALRCLRDDGRIDRAYFSMGGLLSRLENEMPGRRAILTMYQEDYRVVDGITVPFRLRIVVPGTTTVFQADRIVHNLPIDDRVFQKPLR